MAMTSERQLISIVINYDVDGTKMYATYQYTFDDPEDDQLPVQSSKNFQILENTDVTGFDQQVQDLHALVFPTVE